jgi:predicted RNA methylase
MSINPTYYDIDYLREQGYFEEKQPSTGDIDNKTVEFHFDPDNRIAYFENEEIEEIPEIVKSFKRRRNFDYYWFWNSESNRVAVFRTFGENKQFIYNQSLSRSSDFHKSKQKKLQSIETGLTDLFDVKDVVNKFYYSLWDIRLELARSIETPEDIEITDKEKLLTAQRTIDRLVFTYFLVEKGVVHGIDDSGNVLDLDSKILFEELVTDTEDFSGFLDELFFDLLNNPDRDEHIINEQFSIHVPYLNGGLFREQNVDTAEGNEIDETELKYAGFDWESLVEELNKYNWIIEDYVGDENQETEADTNPHAEQNLTPEVLGHIYEKFVITVSELSDDEELTLDELADLEVKSSGELLKGNRKLGAYYTPDYITTENARQVLWKRVTDKLVNERGYEEEKIPDSSREYFDDLSKDDEVNGINKEEVGELLEEITVLDPGVGSGAFPMSVGETMADWLLKCEPDKSRYEIRRSLIKNNLYGVDLLKGATEICKLRLWLWLISASPMIYEEGKASVESLPNIDFNIRQGNSLIGISEAEYDQTIIPHLTFEWVDDEEVTYPEAVEKYQSHINEYRDASGERAEELRQRLKKEESILQEEFDRIYANERSVTVEDEISGPEEFQDVVSELSSKAKVSLDFDSSMTDEEREKLDDLGFTAHSNWKTTAKHKDARVLSQNEDSVKSVFELMDDRGSLILERGLTKSDVNDLGSFHWMFEFPDAFVPNKDRRFDIVIGNPPHGSDLGDLEKSVLEDAYRLIEKRREVAKMFMERSWNLIEGELSFIIPKSSTYSSTWQDFREFGTGKLVRGIDLGKAFQNVQHEQVTLHLSKQNIETKEYICGRLPEGKYELNKGCNIPKEFADLLDTIPVNISEKEFELAKKLESGVHKRLSDFDVKIGRGAPRRDKTQDTDEPIAFKGEEVQRYYTLPAKDRIEETTLSESRRERMETEKVIAQRLVAHIQNPYDHIKLAAVYDPTESYNFETVSNIVLEDEELPSHETFSLLLNSPILNWFTYILIYNRAIRDMDFDGYFVERIILPGSVSDEEEAAFKGYNSLISILSSLQESRESTEDVESDLDILENTMFAFAYELYLRDLEGELSLNTNLSSPICEILTEVDVNYRRWFELEINPEVDSNPEMEQLETEAVEQAKKIAEQLKNDPRIKENMKQIASNEAVKIIERTSNASEDDIRPKFGPNRSSVNQ